MKPRYQLLILFLCSIGVTALCFWATGRLMDFTDNLILRIMGTILGLLPSAVIFVSGISQSLRQKSMTWTVINCLLLCGVVMLWFFLVVMIIMFHNFNGIFTN